MDEWEQEVYAFEYSDQEPEYHCRDPHPRYHQPHDCCDGSEGNCGSYWASKHTDPDCLHVPKDDGWSASRELPPVPPGLSSTRQSSWQPLPDTSAPMKPWVFNRHFLSKPTESRKRRHQWSLSHWTRLHHRHPVFAMPFIQSSLASPNRLLLPHPDDEMLSGSEEDVSSIRDGYTVWVMVDLASILERHLVILNSAKPTFREAQDRRHSSPNPECFNNDAPNRLRGQRKLSILTWNLGPRRGK